MKKILNVPNILTISRVVLVPVFVLFVMYPIVSEPLRYIVAAVIYAITALTDMFDGKIARKYNMITNFGKFMDALADKFMVYSAYIAIALSVMEFNPKMAKALVWLTVVIILRDLVINGIRMLAASSNGTVIAAQFSGKAKTMTQCVSIVIILCELFCARGNIINVNIFDMGVVSYVAMVLTCIATIWSGIDYINSYKKFIDFN